MHRAVRPSYRGAILNSRILTTTVASAAALNLTGCEAVKFVFNAGFVAGIFVVLAVIIGVGYAVSRAL